MTGWVKKNSEIPIPVVMSAPGERRERQPLRDEPHPARARDRGLPVAAPPAGRALPDRRTFDDSLGRRLGAQRGEHVLLVLVVARRRPRGSSARPCRRTPARRAPCGGRDRGSCPRPRAAPACPRRRAPRRSRVRLRRWVGDVTRDVADDAAPIAQPSKEADHHVDPPRRSLRLRGGSSVTDTTRSVATASRGSRRRGRRDPLPNVNTVETRACPRGGTVP